jgi:hypothetical protein
VVALALLAGLWAWGRPAYQRSKERRFERMAAEYFAAQDYRNAWLSALQTLRFNTSNVPALRVAAEVAALARLPSELDWRQRLAAHEPTPANQLQAVACAVRMERPPFPVAAELLGNLPAALTNTPAYHALAAELELRRGRLPEARLHFQNAANVEPENPVYRLNLAAVSLQASNRSEVATARAALERIAADPTHGAAALGWLVEDDLRQRDLASAANHSARLLAHPRATLANRLQHLTILWDQGGGPKFTNALEQLQSQVATNSAEVLDVSSWMVAHGLTESSLGWLRQLPPEVQARQPVPLAVVNCLLDLRDWPGLEDFLRGPSWGEVEYLRQAFLSEAARQLDQTVSSESRWRTAVREAGASLGALAGLAVLAKDWGRAKERAELLWQIAQRFPQQRWALRELDQFYQQTRNLRGLNRVYQSELAFAPTNIFLRNNFIASSLLLDQGVPEAAVLGEQLYRDAGTNPVVASTHAFGLHKRGLTREGLEVLGKLPPEQLESPAIATYYAVLLAAAGETNRALRYSALAQKGELFGEELELLARFDPALQK